MWPYQNEEHSKRVEDCFESDLYPQWGTYIAKGLLFMRLLQNLTKGGQFTNIMENGAGVNDTSAERLISTNRPPITQEDIMNRRETVNLPCPNCQGEGRIGKKDGQTVRDCPRCEGTGEIPVAADEGLNIFESTIEGMKAVSNYQMRREYR